MQAIATAGPKVATQGMLQGSNISEYDIDNSTTATRPTALNKTVDSNYPRPPPLLRTVIERVCNFAGPKVTTQSCTLSG